MGDRDARLGGRMVERLKALSDRLLYNFEKPASKAESYAQCPCGRFVFLVDLDRKMLGKFDWES